MSILVRNTEELTKVAKDFLATLSPGNTATVVALSGDLGAGKTAFTKALANLLGIVEIVTSPTFVIEKIYELKGQSFTYLIHIDAYRIDRSEELRHLGFDQIVSSPENLIVIEWPERVQDIIPKNAKQISFKFIDETTREITFQ
jgi:tRNA threonylcarbamoyladenosine biosynthesis protein TsaE